MSVHLQSGLKKITKTFSYRRLEVVTGSPAAGDFKERWPALFCEAEIKAEFGRITTISLEQSFMYKLDHYTPTRIALMKAKGGVLGTKLRPFLETLSQKELAKCCSCTIIIYRNITMENVFTSIPLAEKLLEKNLTIVGTLFQDKTDIPPIRRPSKLREKHRMRIWIQWQHDHECEQEESRHWLRVEAPAADKMAMLQRTKVFCTKGQHNTELCPHSKDRVSALLTLTFDTLHRLYVGSLI
ncbi:hypothetical protein KUCAC02_011892, partial [Chaenocephalus aceratus]